MTYNEFIKNVTFDISDAEENDTKQVVAIFSVGFLRDFPKDLTKSNPELVQELVARDLYDMLRIGFKDA